MKFLKITLVFVLGYIAAHYIDHNKIWNTVKRQEPVKQAKLAFKKTESKAKEVKAEIIKVKEKVQSNVTKVNKWVYLDTQKKEFDSQNNARCLIKDIQRIKIGENKTRVVSNHVCQGSSKHQVSLIKQINQELAKKFN